jgi:hypothetical protein
MGTSVRYKAAIISGAHVARNRLRTIPWSGLLHRGLLPKRIPIGEISLAFKTIRGGMGYSRQITTRGSAMMIHGVTARCDGQYQFQLAHSGSQTAGNSDRIAAHTGDEVYRYGIARQRVVRA